MPERNRIPAPATLRRGPRRRPRRRLDGGGEGRPQRTETRATGGSRVYAAWCRERGFRPVPADTSTVVAFVDAMAEVRATATVRRYVSSVAAAPPGSPASGDDDRSPGRWRRCGSDMAPRNQAVATPPSAAGCARPGVRRPAAIRCIDDLTPDNCSCRESNRPPRRPACTAGDLEETVVFRTVPDDGCRGGSEKGNGLRAPARPPGGVACLVASREACSSNLLQPRRSMGLSYAHDTRRRCSRGGVARWGTRCLP